MFKRAFKSIRANILMGLFLTIPVVVTVLIFDFLFKLTTNWLPEKAFPNLNSIWHGYLLRTLTLLVVVLFLYFVGLLMRNFFGRRLYRFADMMLTRIPIIKGIYVSVRQISESLFAQRSTLFKEVVLVEYPRKGLYSMAFVTAMAPPKVTRLMMGDRPDEPCISLFIATTPNPTSGVFILVPRSCVIPLDMPVADALTFIMSAGAVSPGESRASAPSLIDKLESWLKHDKEATAGATDVTV